MDAYIEVRLLPDPEFPLSFLFGALYGKFHRALVMLASDDIGVSFPDYSLSPRTLGNRLRLHGTETALSRLMALDWLSGMADHVQCSEVLPVPEAVHHRTVARRQFKTSSERLRRRRMKRKGETHAQAAHAIPDSAKQTPHLPFVHIRSNSTGQKFALFIELGEMTDQPVPGRFNSYGLSRQATVPWF